MTTYPKSNFSYTFLESIRKLRSQTTLEIGPTLEICGPHEDSGEEETMIGVLERDRVLESGPMGEAVRDFMVER